MEDQTQTPGSTPDFTKAMDTSKLRDEAMEFLRSRKLNLNAIQQDLGLNNLQTMVNKQTRTLPLHHVKKLAAYLSDNYGFKSELLQPDPNQATVMGAGIEDEIRIVRKQDGSIVISGKDMTYVRVDAKGTLHRRGADVTSDQYKKMAIKLGMFSQSAAILFKELATK